MITLCFLFLFNELYFSDVQLIILLGVPASQNHLPLDPHPEIDSGSTRSKGNYVDKICLLTIITVPGTMCYSKV